jgi:hypothetical protein
MRCTILESGHVNAASVSKCVLGKTIRVYLDLMSLQIHLRVENHEFLFQAFSIGAKEVVFAEVYLESIVVNKVLLLSPFISPVTYVTSLMLVSAMGIQLIVAIEALSTKATFWVSLETTLVDSSGVVVTKFLVFTQFSWCEELMLMCEHFFVSCTEVASHMIS